MPCSYSTMKDREANAMNLPWFLTLREPPPPCAGAIHYYRNANLSRLENSCCPGFPTRNTRPGQKGVLLSRVWQPGQKTTNTNRVTNQDKRCCQRYVAGAPFCPGWCYQRGQKVPFFFLFFFSQFFFYFNYTFTFQLNLCIGIQCL